MANPASLPVPLTAPVLSGISGVSHGFFTRQGGVSEGLYASLNCGPGSDDAPAAVAENRARAAAVLGVSADTLVTAYQVHSPDVVRVAHPWTVDAPPRADGLVTDQPGIALGVLTADCAPVLFADVDAGVIGVAHAGWKGAIGGVLETTVQTMIGLGADPANIRAAIGPTIGPDSYEVGEEFKERFLAEGAHNGAFFRDSSATGHALFNLPGYIESLLVQIGLAAVEVLGRDTLTDEKTFFSYRRTTLAGGGDYGRQLSAIALKP